MAATDFRDYYATLGVSRTADTDEIKKVYRKLARKYHPDMNPGDRQAEAKFKEVTEAYEVLSDPEKRKKYDQFGQYWNRVDQGHPWPGGTGGSTNFNEFEFGRYSTFEEFVNELLGRFGGPEPSGFGQRANYRTTKTPSGKSGFESPGFGTQPGQNPQGADYESTIKLTLNEAFHGVKKRLNLGAETIEVGIPAGTKNGTKIRVRGKGQMNPYSKQRGDLYLVADLETHTFFQFDSDNNLVCEVAITPDEAVLGAEIEVPTPDGAVTVKVPAGVRSGQSLRLRSKGWPNPKGGRSDQLVQIVIVPPKEISALEREAYEKIRANRKFDPRSHLKQVRL